MTMTTIEVSTIEPIAHPEAMRLQAEELDRTPGLLRSLDAASWTAQTDCPAWDVRRDVPARAGRLRGRRVDPGERPPVPPGAGVPQAARRTARGRADGRAGTCARRPVTRADR